MYSQIFFDFDSTLSPLEGIDVIADFLEREGIDEITKRCMDGEIDVRQAFELRIQKLSVKKHQLQYLGEIYLSNLTPGTLELLEVLEFLKKEVIIVSGGFGEALRVVCAKLGIKKLRALELDFDNSEIGQCMHSPLIEKDGKAQIVQELKQGKCAFIGDGFTDFQVDKVVDLFIPYAGVCYRSWMDQVQGSHEIYSGENLLGLLPILLTSSEYEKAFNRFGVRMQEAALHYKNGSNRKDLESENYQKIKQYLPSTILIPGPTQVHDAVQSTVYPAVGHRSKEFEKLYSNCQRMLKSLLGTSKEILTFNSSATGVMEALCTSLELNSRVLSLQSGAFAQRFADVAKLAGLRVDTIVASPGRAVQASSLSQLREKNYRAIFITHSETSNGTLQDVNELTKLCHAIQPSAFVFVDGVSSATQIEICLENVDAFFFGTQKCLALPPGLAFCAVSSRFEEYLLEQKCRSYYFDLHKTLVNHRQGNVPYTPAIDLFQKLQMQLQFFVPKKNDRYALAKKIAQMVWEFASKHGLKIYAASGERSLTVTSLEIPVSIENFFAKCKDRGLNFASGYGDLKGLHFRIGHMGNLSKEEMESVLDRLKEILNG